MVGAPTDPPRAVARRAWLISASGTSSNWLRPPWFHQPCRQHLRAGADAEASGVSNKISGSNLPGPTLSLRARRVAGSGSSIATSAPQERTSADAGGGGAGGGARCGPERRPRPAALKHVGGRRHQLALITMTRKKMTGMSPTLSLQSGRCWWRRPACGSWSRRRAADATATAWVIWRLRNLAATVIRSNEFPGNGGAGIRGQCQDGMSDMGCMGK